MAENIRNILSHLAFIGNIEEFEGLSVDISTYFHEDDPDARSQGIPYVSSL